MHLPIKGRVVGRVRLVLLFGCFPWQCTECGSQPAEANPTTRHCARVENNRAGAFSLLVLGCGHVDSKSCCLDFQSLIPYLNIPYLFGVAVLLIVEA